MNEKFIPSLSGEVFGRLTIVQFGGRNKEGKRRWSCKCNCGNEIVVLEKSLKSGNTKSCGCLQKDIARELGRSMLTKHGLTNSPLHAVWWGMIQRCYDKNYSTFINYGARGITICDEWKNDFKNFYDWSMSNGYKEGLSIDRYPNNNGNYEPGNCRFTTSIEQNNNKRDNHLITLNEQTKTISEWAKFLNIDHRVLRSRIHKGWSEEKTLTTPARKNKKTLKQKI